MGRHWPHPKAQGSLGWVGGKPPKVSEIPPVNWAESTMWACGGGITDTKELFQLMSTGPFPSAITAHSACLFPKDAPVPWETPTLSSDSPGAGLRSKQQSIKIAIVCRWLNWIPYNCSSLPSAAAFAITALSGCVIIPVCTVTPGHQQQCWASVTVCWHHSEPERDPLLLKINRSCCLRASKRGKQSINNKGTWCVSAVCPTTGVQSLSRSIMRLEHREHQVWAHPHPAASLWCALHLQLLTGVV